MDHIEALRIGATEQYLLDEMPDRLREEFEEHLFECQECALDVRAGKALIGQMKKELQAKPKGAPAVKRRPFLSSFVLTLAGALAASMGIVLVYQNTVTLPRLHREIAAADSPAVLQATSLMNGASRGVGMPLATVSAGQPLLLYVDLPTDDRFVSYRLTFHTPSGSLAGTIVVSPEQARNPLLVRLPAHEVSSGVYTLAVEGVPESRGPVTELAQYRFQVRNGG